MKRRCVSLVHLKWTVLSMMAAALILLVYEGVREYAFPIVVNEESGTRIEACFTPERRCQKKIIREIEKAEHEILVMAYSFTAKPIAEALLAAKARGVTVRVIADYSQRTQEHSQITILSKGGIPVTFDKSVVISHNKVMVIDHRTTIQGSYNFTNAAEHRNAENILFIESLELAKEYKSNWLERLSAATSFSTDSGDRPVGTSRKKHDHSRH